jgi:hypothetical protein
MDAKLPAELIEAEPRRLRDVGVGETVYVWSREMDVAADRSCWLNPAATLSGRGESAIEVTRRESGYCVKVISGYRKWIPRGSAPEGWIEVEEIVHDLDPELE